MKLGRRGFLKGLLGLAAAPAAVAVLPEPTHLVRRPSLGKDIPRVAGLGTFQTKHESYALDFRVSREWISDDALDLMRLIPDDVHQACQKYNDDWTHALMSDAFNS